MHLDTRVPRAKGACIPGNTLACFESKRYTLSGPENNPPKECKP